MQWLVEDAQPGDRFFLHYSGHGGAVVDVDGDEVDGMDETILPLDYETEGEIVDDDIFKICIAPLPAGSRLIAVFDSCHSGSIMDLQFTYTTDGGLESMRKVSQAEALHHCARGFADALAGNRQWAVNEMASAFQFFKQGTARAKKAVIKSMTERLTRGTVVQFSACSDWEKSVDITDPGQSVGVMSWALLKCLKDNQHPKLAELLRQTRNLVGERSNQSVTMSTGHPLDPRHEVFSVL
ncbi:Ca(2+)-dependent cysteine protease [Blyttiomyces sp. JEL0837]|nr:Ca(2+)-dependent cysteine protease [Blyttiomyces sp. JEL0837]